MGLIELKGITWNHKRGYDPLVYTTKEFHEKHPDIQIHWDKRSLKDFGDFPIEKLAEKYDLLLIDHPFTGQAAQKNLYVELDNCIAPEHLEQLKNESIGKCFESYCYDGRVLALPVDAAAIVSACRLDLMQQAGLEVPRNLEEVFQLHRQLPEGKKILVGLCPTDIWCVLLSLCAAASDGHFIDEEKGMDVDVLWQGVEQVKRLAEISGEDPFSLNPIGILDRMSGSDAYLYSPFLFGYINYSMKGEYPHIVHFYDAPLQGNTSALLGGVGIAISTHSTHVKEAAQYVAYVTDGEVQRTSYFNSGGQPSHASVWHSQEIDTRAHGFFSNTLHTMEHAYMRPRIPGWNDFQEAGGSLICTGLQKGISPKQLAEELQMEFFRRFCKKEGA